MKKIIIVSGTVVCVLLILVVGLISCGNHSTNKTEAEAPAVEAVEPTGVVINYDGTPDLTATPSELTVIDFNATWCGPCKKFAPIFHSVAEKYEGKAKFYSVDVDRNPDLADYYDANAIPKVVVLFPDGTKHESIGLITAEDLEELMK